MTKAVQHSDVTHQYLRIKKRFPNVWCAGCGIGTVMGSIIRAVDFMEYKKDEVALVSGIGCSSRLPVYCDFNTLHTTHGRALAFATGVKIAKPNLKVIVITGDGDGLAIGGNHFIHACRRNIDITTILINNRIYGMTGGQFSPTTPWHANASTAPYGNMERAFDPAALAIAAGASYVARGTVYHVQQLDKLIIGGLQKRGFALIEAFSNCHTYYGRLNKEGDAVAMLNWMKDHALPVKAAAALPPEKREGKLLTGVLHDVEMAEYCDEYQKLVDRLQTKQEA
ncbi:MAG: 2-oxoacid:ferredoxin oxidoreductase subunit beta [candidate division Zixibacteria bacterium]|nr:2-oxoacid:ferredoxin oxidoreductase subunit beta [candidate division Zixibacteria bacterium]